MNDVSSAAVESVLSRFDFERVHRAMTALDWKWGRPSAGAGEMDVPTLEQLRETAGHLLHQAWAENDRRNGSWRCDTMIHR